jgi:hypothetical protein
MARKGNLDGISGRGIARVPSHRKQNGSVLFHSTFEGASFEGWRQHYSGTEETGDPYPPPSLTRYPVKSGEYALLLTTTARAYEEIPAGNALQGPSAYKNLTRYDLPATLGLVSFSGYFAEWHSGGYAPVANWGLGIDSQLFDNSDRSFFKVQCRYPEGKEPQWYLTDNEGKSRPLPSNISKNISTGINQNKFNFNYVELVVNMNENSGRGAYHSLQVNEKVFDLTDPANWPANLGGAPNWSMAQSGQQTTQGSASGPKNTAEHFLDFRGGMNFGIFGDLNSGALGSFGLICDELVGTIYDAD